VGTPPQHLLIDEVAKEGAVGTASFAHRASGKNYFPDITTS